jgi:hypothetical protein
MADRDAATLRVIEELKRIYKTKIMPLEQVSITYLSRMLFLCLSSPLPHFSLSKIIFLMKSNSYTDTTYFTVP